MIGTMNRKALAGLYLSLSAFQAFADTPGPAPEGMKVVRAPDQSMIDMAKTTFDLYLVQSFQSMPTNLYYSAKVAGINNTAVKGRRNTQVQGETADKIKETFAATPENVIAYEAKIKEALESTRAEWDAELRKEFTNKEADAFSSIKATNHKRFVENVTSRDFTVFSIRTALEVYLQQKRLAVRPDSYHRSWARKTLKDKPSNLKITGTFRKEMSRKSKRVIEAHTWLYLKKTMGVNELKFASDFEKDPVYKKFTKFRKSFIARHELQSKVDEVNKPLIEQIQSEADKTATTPEKPSIMRLLNKLRPGRAKEMGPKDEAKAS